jgi:CRISPR type I-E-associated protein CasA/Cse1
MAKIVELSFNALTDAWLPLMTGNGKTEWASPVEVLCGEKDGFDLDYPRDDFRVYARLLLSALVQALFAAKDPSELVARLRTPMTRSEVEKIVKAVNHDFDLFGPKPFLQMKPKTGAKLDGGAAPFVFVEEDLFRPSIVVDAISLPIALVMLFIEQTYAGGAGRGYGAGPGGQPGTFTLIDPGTVRMAAWANTIHRGMASSQYAKDGSTPWSNSARAARPRAATGLVEGLFFQPRATMLTLCGAGVCSFSGTIGSLVRRSPLQPKSELSKKPTKGEDIWRHPCAPMALNSQGLAVIRLSTERPSWTGLANLLAPLSKQANKKEHPLQGPALVVQQWKALVGFTKKERLLRLLILDFDRDKANVRRRFFEGFSLSQDVLGNESAIERLRDLAGDARDVDFELSKAIKKAHDGREGSRGGFALPDARASFWSTTETNFSIALKLIVQADELNENAMLENLRSTKRGLRKMALKIFDDHVAASEFDARKQERIALARRGLVNRLFSNNLPKTTKQPEAKQ